MPKILKTTIMTEQQYIDRIRDRVFRDIYEDVLEFDKAFVPETETKEYWLYDLKTALVPGGSKHLRVETRLRGYWLEITADWPYYIYFGNGNLLNKGSLIIGDHVLPLPSFERAVNALRHLCEILPGHIRTYNSEKVNVRLEVEKHRMLARICVSTILPVLEPLAEASGFTCSVKGSGQRITVQLVHREGVKKTFYLNSENPMEHLEDIKAWIVSSGGRG